MPAALIKKRRYWPKHVNGDVVKEHFNNKPVGAADCYESTLDEVKYQIHGMKEPDYTMMLMSTYGTLERHGDEKHRLLSDGTRVTFRYPELVYNHFKYRHAVDDHNNRRQSPIALEKTWTTSWWPNRVFTFLLAVTEINVLLCLTNMFNEEEMGTLEFRKLLAKQLIHNPYLEDDTDARKRKSGRISASFEHRLLGLERFKKFSGAQIVTAESEYPQRRCSMCRQKKTRNYCSCTPGVMLCPNCFGQHLLVVNSD